MPIGRERTAKHGVDPRVPAVLLLLIATVLCLSQCAMALAETASSAGPIPTNPEAPQVLAFTGKAVNFDLSGLEPDFDPLYRVVVTGTLHDRRTSGQPLPDSTLVLSTYLEVFQPDTTPVLPDILHPNNVAGNLAGFLSGKAALVSAGGQVVYRGSLLAEIFQDNSEHLVVDLSPAAGSNSVRLEGVVALLAGARERGTLRALSPLERAKLAVPRGSAPSWQQVVGKLSVPKPAMIGTGGTAGKRPPPQPSTIAPAALRADPAVSPSCAALCRVRRPVTLIPLCLGVAAVLAGIVMRLSQLHAARPKS